MGGIGSGSEPQRTLVEDCLILDANELARQGCFQLGSLTSMENCWKIDGVTVAKAVLEIDLRCDRYQPQMRLTLSRPHHEDVSQMIALRDITPTYGGIRWFFKARNSALCQKLYMTPRSNRFGTRQEFQLTYRSKRLCPSARARWRAQQLRESLPGARFDHYPPRPRGMHQKTYDRLVSQLREADDKVRENWQASIIKTGERLGLV
jgi:hypothetical protein